MKIFFSSKSESNCCAEQDCTKRHKRHEKQVKSKKGKVKIVELLRWMMIFILGENEFVSRELYLGA